MSASASRTGRRPNARERVAHALDRVGLSDKAKVWPRELSGGQAQRVAIARALVPRPQVLLLDEPFSALDAFTRVDLQDHLLNLWAEFKPTLVMVTHDVEEAIALADRIVVMRPRPGQVADEIEIDLPRPRDRQSAAFDFAKRRVLAALDRSLDRAVGVGASRAQGRPGRGDVVVGAASFRVHARALCRASTPLLYAGVWTAHCARPVLRRASARGRSCAASRSAPAASRFSATNIRRRKPAGTEVLLKVLAAGVCHSDLHLSDGYFDLGGGKRMSLEDRGMKLPVTLGHENVGEVVAVGPAARKASRSATAGWRIPGSAAAPARSASAARKISAAP